jgi:hypothetical protein
MKNRFATYSLLAVLGAIVAWATVAFFAWTLVSLQVDRAKILSEVEKSRIQNQAATKVHAVLQETTRERAALVLLSNADVLEVVRAIEATGPAAGSDLQVRGAQPGQVVAAKKGVPALRPIVFNLQVEGTYPAVMKTAQLLEALPFPIDVTQFEISRGALEDKATGDVRWRMNITLKLLTTSEISS